MVDPPAVEMTIEPVSEFSVSDALVERADQLRGPRSKSGNSDAACLPHPRHIAARTHRPWRWHAVGLSIAAGLRRFLELPELSAEALVASVGRGRRSAVGTHGFLHGGLIVDAGKESGQTLGTLSERVAVPDDWRFVLVTKRASEACRANRGRRVYPPAASAGRIDARTVAAHGGRDIAGRERMDCAVFGEAVYHFGRFAGECFAAVQGGPFASEEIGRLVDALRNHGIDGVGQSSWGPTVFAIVPNEAEARLLTDWLHTEMRLPRDVITIAQANNCGAVIR